MRLVQVFCMILSLVMATCAVPNFIAPKSPAAGSKVVDRAIIGRLDTNAKRLAAGLPPLPARRLWSRTDTAKRWNTSPVPYQGKLGVKAANGTFIGFVSKALSRYGTYVADLNEPNAACVYFSALKFGKTTGISLKDITSQNPETPFLGAVIQHGYSLAPRKGWKRQSRTAPDVPVVGTEQSARDQPAHQLNNTYNPSGGSSPDRSGSASGADGASAIWTFDPATQQWGATWINSDGSEVDTTPYYNPDSPPGVVLVSDVQAYSAVNPNAFPVSLNLSP